MNNQQSVLFVLFGLSKTANSVSEAELKAMKPLIERGLVNYEYSQLHEPGDHVDVVITDTGKDYLYSVLELAGVIYKRLSVDNDLPYPFNQ